MSLLWIFIKPLFSLLFLVPVIFGFTIHQRVISVPSKQKKSLINPVSVMTYNIQLFGLNNWEENTEQRNEIIDLINATSPDILCLQEYFHNDNQEKKSAQYIKNILGYSYSYFSKGKSNSKGHEFGIIIFSKYPILHAETISFDGMGSKTNMAQFVDIILDADTLRVYNAHLASVHLNVSEVDQIMEGDEKSIVLSKKWLRKMKRSYQIREKQVKELKKSMDNSPYPVLLCADLNDVPVSNAYNQLTKKLEDAFLQSSYGIGETYHGKLPFLRIDYIFHSYDLQSAEFKVIEKGLTDHYPVTCEIEFKK